MTHTTKAITEFVFAETPLAPAADVILVPGARRQYQMHKAAELYHQGYAPLIVPSGGSNPHLPPHETEWQHLYQTGVDRGVPAGAILCEDRATNTFENARFSREVLDECGIEVRRAILVCKAFHARRALLTYATEFPPDVEFMVCPTLDHRQICRDTWHTNTRHTEIVMGEVAKIGAYFGRHIPTLCARTGATTCTSN